MSNDSNKGSTTRDGSNGTSGEKSGSSDNQKLISNDFLMDISVSSFIADQTEKIERT